MCMKRWKATQKPIILGGITGSGTVAMAIGGGITLAGTQRWQSSQHEGSKRSKMCIADCWRRDPSKTWITYCMPSRGLL
jgi:hypothetical protein